MRRNLGTVHGSRGRLHGAIDRPLRRAASRLAMTRAPRVRSARHDRRGMSPMERAGAGRCAKTAICTSSSAQPPPSSCSSWQGGRRRCSSTLEPAARRVARRSQPLRYRTAAARLHTTAFRPVGCVRLMWAGHGGSRDVGSRLCGRSVLGSRPCQVPESRSRKQSPLRPCGARRAGAGVLRRRVKRNPPSASSPSAPRWP